MSVTFKTYRDSHYNEWQRVSVRVRVRTESRFIGMSSMNEVN